MKKNSYAGVDLGDRNHEVCVLDAEGQVMERERVANTAEAIVRYFGSKPRTMAVALEAGTHSGWISRLLESMGFRVVVAQPRKLRALWGRDRKNDASDAELLGRMLRADPKLLHPITHRSEAAHVAILSIRARDALVRMRTQAINTARGLAKSVGHRLPSASAEAFARKASEGLPKNLEAALLPLIEVVMKLTEQIKEFNRQVEAMAQTTYAQTAWMRTVPGVGALTSLAYVLTVADPDRFERSREVGPYLGLVPRQDQSGSIDKQLHITKAGDGYLRRLLVGSAQYILGPFGPPCGLRSFGLRLAARGGKNAKRRAVVAVARKLAVLLHALWVNQTTYDPARGLSGMGPQPCGG
jgi:transposase